MKTNADAAHFLAIFVDELYQSGVHHMVVSPGSRSTPLAMTAARHEQIKLWIHVDERSAAFFALGMAKMSGRPVALICTSGTAAANYLPAVVEAYYARVPLILLTADRPHELRDVGASQTIDQLNLYNKHVKWFTDVALPENHPVMHHYICRTASRAVAHSCTAPAGPVHLNFPFREPLVPDFTVLEENRKLDKTPSDAPSPLIAEEKRATIQVMDGWRQLKEEQVDQLADQLLNFSRSIMVCGPVDHYQGLEELITLAETLQIPLLADPLSNLRSTGRLSPVVIDSYDAFLRLEDVVKRLKPDGIIRFGAMPISKPYMLYSQHWAGIPHLVVDGGAGWRDPHHLVTEMVYADPYFLCHALIPILQRKLNQVGVQQRKQRDHWLKLWQRINQATRRAIKEEMERFDSMFEGRLFSELADLLPEQSVLYVGNSMPVRDLDTFFETTPKTVRILANRGASGIDGLVSSALGASCVTAQPVVLVVGDLSFYHDLNGLLPAKLYDLNLTIVLVNNNGGGIFSFLPQAEHPEHFEQLFGTPLNLDFSHAAHLYGGTFTRVRSWSSFRESFQRALASQGLNIIELSSHRQENVVLHRQVWQAVQRTLLAVRDENE